MVVATGQQAFEAFKGEVFKSVGARSNDPIETRPLAFRVIVLDFQMPADPGDEIEGGIETALKIRKFEKEQGLPSIPIYGYTSNNLDSFPASLTEEGIFNQIFDKLQSKELIDRVQSHLT